MGNLYKDYQPPSSGGGKYLKLEDGKTVRLKIVSEPVVFDNEYEGQLSTKYAWKVWNYDEKVAQILQLPVTGYRAVAEIGGDDDWGDPLTNDYVVKVTRKGTGLDTKYTVTPGPAKDEDKLDDDATKAVEELDLIGSLESGRGVSRVNWLRDVIKNGRPAPKADSDETIIEDLDGDEPVDLSDIPF